MLSKVGLQRQLLSSYNITGGSRIDLLTLQRQLCTNAKATSRALPCLHCKRVEPENDIQSIFPLTSMESNLFDVHFQEVETMGLPTGWIGKLETKLAEKGQKTGNKIL